MASAASGDAGRTGLRGLRHRAVYGLVVAARAPFLRMRPARAVRIGAAAGRAYAHLRGPRTASALRNLELAFPDWTAERRRQVLVESFANLGRSLAELAVLAGPHREELLDSIEVEAGSDERLAAAKAAAHRGGVIVLTAHFGAWELCAAALARLGYPLSVVHHGFANPFLADLVQSWRTAEGGEVLELGSAGLGVVRALRRGRLVAMLVDQNAAGREGVFAPFFGIPASTRSGPALLAMGQGFAVLPVFCFRRPHGAGHLVRADPPLEIESGASERAGALLRNVARMNAAVEATVREAPEQWLWAHRRFRTRPDGEDALYPRRHRLRRGLRDGLRRLAGRPAG